MKLLTKHGELFGLIAWIILVAALLLCFPGCTTLNHRNDPTATDWVQQLSPYMAD